MRNALVSGVVPLFLAACSGDTRRQAPEHIFLISIDTTRADRIGCYGGPAKTPVLDKLAREGVRFTDAMTPSPTTLPAHASLMTGDYPPTHGVVRNGFVLQDEPNSTLAEVLARHGFHCAAFLGSFALESRFLFDQGFAHFDEQFDLEVTPDLYFEDQRTARSVTDAVLKHVEQHLDQRMFLFVHYFDPHAPYTPRGTAVDRREQGRLADIDASVRAHQADIIGEELGFANIIHSGPPRELIESGSVSPSAEDRRLIQLYDEEIERVDAELGRLLDGLECMGLLENAIVIAIADHGESFLEHGDYWNHGMWLYQSTIHVPLILSWPGAVDPGTVEDETVSLIDVAPTVLDALGLPSDCEGRSLLRLPEHLSEPRALFAQATQPGAAFEQGQTWPNAQKASCVREGRWKYIVAPFLGAEQLFDVESDPNEQQNLLRRDGPLPVGIEGVHTRLRNQLTDWVARPPRLQPQENREQYEETLRRLGALGYSEGGSSK